jgi:hypothetical protein
VDGTVLRPTNGQSFCGADGRNSRYPAHDLRGVFDLPEDRTGVHVADGMRAKQEARHHTEISAAAAQRPEQIRVLALARRDEAAVSEHHVRFQQVVDREAVHATQVTAAAAESETGNARGGNNACRNCQAECMRGVIDVALRAAGFDANRARRRVDADSFQPAEIDHDPAVAAAETGAVVTAAANCEQQIAIAREFNRRNDVRHVAATCDHVRPFLDHRVVELAGLLVAGIRSSNQVAAKRFCERRESRTVKHRLNSDVDECEEEERILDRAVAPNYDREARIVDWALQRLPSVRRD